MQKVTEKEIMPFTKLTCVQTDKFKTGCISINFITQLSRETASLNALLPRVLFRGTSEHPDMESLSAATDELYGARIKPVLRKKGELHCIGFYGDFVDDDFLPPGENLLEHAASLLGEVILSPNTRGGILLSEYVESERKNLIDEIRAGINNKRVYAADRLLELMCSDEAYGTNRLGTEKSASAITAQALTKHYRKIIAESDVWIFYSGGSDAGRVELALKSALSSLPRHRSKYDTPSTDVILHAKSTSPRIFKDAMDVSQGKLTVGFRMGKCMTEPNYAALMVANAVYGGSVTSKLFSNVREKLSLCYYASSVIEKMKGIMLVSSGVEFSKFQDALDEILAQLEAVKKGDISDWEMRSARRAVITAIKSALDQQFGMENMYFDHMLNHIGFSPDDFAALADGVTKDEVAAIASGIEIDSIYYLTGTEAVKDDA